MKYFAKYLPVEGGIKTPCIVLETLTNGKTELFQIDTENDIDLKNQKLVKLFLCSKDIQKNNKFYHTFQDKHFTCIGISDYGDIQISGFVGNMNSFPPSEYLIKVIGEISPEATWVKEGDEFDRDDLSANGVGVNWNEKSPDVGKYKFKIKGSCGHYH